MPRTLKPWLPHKKIEKEKINQLERLMRIKEFLSGERYCSFKVKMDSSFSQTLETSFLILFSVAFYAFFAFSFQTIAKKTGTANRWMAWIPILNLILIFSIAGRPAWWIILYFVQFVNLFIWVNIWIEIAELLEKPKWIGSLMILPGINIFALAYLAFT